MKIKVIVKVETGFNCNWRDIEPLQPKGFKGQTENERETLKNSIVQNGFNNAFDIWKHNGVLFSIDGVHRKIALLELLEEGYEIPEQLPCTYIDAKNETEAAIIILSRNATYSYIMDCSIFTKAFCIPADISSYIPDKNINNWALISDSNAVSPYIEKSISGSDNKTIILEYNSSDFDIISPIINSLKCNISEHVLNLLIS